MKPSLIHTPINTTCHSKNHKNCANYLNSIQFNCNFLPLRAANRPRTHTNINMHSHRKYSDVEKSVKLLNTLVVAKMSPFAQKKLFHNSFERQCESNVIVYSTLACVCVCMLHAAVVSNANCLTRKMRLQKSELNYIKS